MPAASDDAMGETSHCLQEPEKNDSFNKASQTHPLKSVHHEDDK